jgi:hypothetical protein
MKVAEKYFGGLREGREQEKWGQKHTEQIYNLYT